MKLKVVTVNDQQTFIPEAGVDWLKLRAQQKWMLKHVLKDQESKGSKFTPPIYETMDKSRKGISHHINHAELQADWYEGGCMCPDQYQG